MRDFIARVRTAVEDLRDQWADADRNIKVAKIQRVFERERRLIAGVLSNFVDKACESPGRCAIGALLVSAGRDDDNLCRGLVEFEEFDLLYQEYGLNMNQVCELMGANDDSENNRHGADHCPKLPVPVARVCVVSHVAAGLAAA